MTHGARCTAPASLPAVFLPGVTSFRGHPSRAPAGRFLPAAPASVPGPFAAAWKAALPAPRATHEGHRRTTPKPILKKAWRKNVRERRGLASWLAFRDGCFCKFCKSFRTPALTKPGTLCRWICPPLTGAGGVGRSVCPNPQVRSTGAGGRRRGTRATLRTHIARRTASLIEPKHRAIARRRRRAGG